MKRLESGDIEVNGKVWHLEMFGYWTLNRWRLSLMGHVWTIVLTDVSNPVIDNFADTPEECIAQVKLAAERVGEL